MFRRIYWVTEWIYADGHSEVRGVYTSIPNLLKEGLPHPDDVRVRLTLTKLDSEKAPLGVWEQPQFEGLDQKLEEFVRTEEFTKDQCHALMDALMPSAQVAA